jgi:hypothetical protein
MQLQHTSSNACQSELLPIASELPYMANFLQDHRFKLLRFRSAGTGNRRTLTSGSPLRLPANFTVVSAVGDCQSHFWPVRSPSLLSGRLHKAMRSPTHSLMPPLFSLEILLTFHELLSEFAQHTHTT